MKKISILFLLLLVQSKLFAQSGFLDPAFGNQGQIAFHADTFSIERVKGMAFTTEGKLLILASYQYENYIYRLNSNGTIDSAFGDQGLLTLQIVQYNFEYVAATAIAVDSMNRILLYGRQEYADGMFLYRYLTDGTPDTSFGYGAAAPTDVYVGDRGLLVQPNGKIIVAGQNEDEEACVSRFNKDGIIDSSFHGTGVSCRAGTMGGGLS